jgi:hypothetical protein
MSKRRTIVVRCRAQWGFVEHRGRRWAYIPKPLLLKSPARLRIPSAVFLCQRGLSYSQPHQGAVGATLRYSASRSQPAVFTKSSTAQCGRFSVLRDGRRHIAEFYLAGDFFGLEANSTHALSAETICNSNILIIKRSVLAVLAEHDKDIVRHLSDMMGGELGRAQAPCHTVGQDFLRACC